MQTTSRFRYFSLALAGTDAKFSTLGALTWHTARLSAIRSLHKHI